MSILRTNVARTVLLRGKVKAVVKTEAVKVDAVRDPIAREALRPQEAKDRPVRRTTKWFVGDGMTDINQRMGKPAISPDARSSIVV